MYPIVETSSKTVTTANGQPWLRSQLGALLGWLRTHTLQRLPFEQAHAQNAIHQQAMRRSIQSYIANREADQQIHSPEQVIHEWEQLRRDFEKARKVQQGFLPQLLPNIDGLEIFADMHPATEVCGDFYDFIIGPQGQLIFVVGDISSKGISAALFMPAICKIIRTAIRVLDEPSPQAILDYVHNDLYTELNAISMFVTMFVGCYYPQCGSLFYANAGHSPVIYRPWQGRAHLLRADNPPIGILQETDWVHQQLTLSPNDLLFIGTDGIPETRNAGGKLYGYERLVGFIEQMAHANVSEIAYHLMASIHGFAARHAERDDKTIMLFKGMTRV